MTAFARALKRLFRRPGSRKSNWGEYRGAPDATRCLQEGARWARDHTK